MVALNDFFHGGNRHFNLIVGRFPGCDSLQHESRPAEHLHQSGSGVFTSETDGFVRNTGNDGQQENFVDDPVNKIGTSQQGED